MIVLALDLTSEFGSLALRIEGKPAAALTLDSTEGFAHLIFPAIEELLDRAEVKLREVNCFASASGPGAFTGVRVGLSAVKGLAEATRSAAAGISNLRALSSFGTGDRRAVVLDARRGEIFGAVYGPDLEIVSAEVVTKWPLWLETLPASEYEFVSLAGFPLRQMLAGTRFAAMHSREAPRYLAEAVAFCAELDGKLERWSDPAALDANYVRRSDAELFWKDK